MGSRSPAETPEMRARPKERVRRESMVSLLMVERMTRRRWWPRSGVCSGDIEALGPDGWKEDLSFWWKDGGLDIPTRFVDLGFSAIHSGASLKMKIRQSSKITPCVDQMLMGGRMSLIFTLLR